MRDTMSKNVVVKAASVSISAVASMGCLIGGPLVVPWNMTGAVVAHGVFIALACLFAGIAIVLISKEQ